MKNLNSAAALFAMIVTFILVCMAFRCFLNIGHAETVAVSFFGFVDTQGWYRNGWQQVKPTWKKQVLFVIGMTTITPALLYLCLSSVLLTSEGFDMQRFLGASAIGTFILSVGWAVIWREIDLSLFRSRCLQDRQ